MPSPVELALSSLLPHIAFPPDELQRLTTSLLTQSRVRAPRLKPDEEVARTFACAHLACERLQNRLELEIAKDVRPPCPPRVYARLKGFLTGIVATTSKPPPEAGGGNGAGGGNVVGGKRKRGTDSDTPQTPRGMSKVGTTTPTTTATTPTRTPVATPTTATKPATPATAVRKRTFAETGATGYDGADGIPGFVTPLLSHVCSACKIHGRAAGVAERVRIGAVEVVKEIASRRKPEGEGPAGSVSKRRRGGRMGKETVTTTTTPQPSPAQLAPVVPVSRWPALLIALLLCVVAKARGLEVDAVEMKDTRRLAVEVVEGFDVEDGSRISEELAQDSDEVDRMISFYLLEAGDCGWLEMEWYRDFAAVGDIDRNHQQEEVDEDPPVKPRRLAKTPLRRKEKHGGQGDVDDERAPAGLLPGLGTMFQPAIDWLSDERRAQFGEWKQEILKRIATIEQQA